MIPRAGLLSPNSILERISRLRLDPGWKTEGTTGSQWSFFEW
ncbi:hypothetical protein ACFLVN_04065 [Chloroflexota bacterium]